MRCQFSVHCTLDFRILVMYGRDYLRGIVIGNTKYARHETCIYPPIPFIPTLVFSGDFYELQ